MDVDPHGGLTGIRVVDFGHQLAGPLAALLLAEAGADVVHVDSPSTAAHPHPGDAFYNRSKRRITLDLTREADRVTAHELIDRADVVIENFRPGVMDRFGLGAGALCAADERLVHCSIPGFAPDDPRASVAAWEGIVQAAVAGYRPLDEHWDPSGRTRATVEDRTAPLFTPITTASNFGGLSGAVSIVMALIARERSGRGQRIRIPLTEAFTEAYSTMLGMRVYANKNPLMGDGHMLRDLTYRTADDGIIDLSPYAKFVIPLLVAAGEADRWQADGLIDIAARTCAKDRREEIIERFTELVGTRPASWWDDVAAAAEVPVSRVRTPAEWMTSEHATVSGAAVTLIDPVLGPLLLPGRGFDLGDPVRAPAPRRLPDQDRASVLAELATPSTRGSSRIVGDGRRGVDLPLEGIKGIDISQAVAGPTAARLLADFGADIIKIGSTTPAVTDGIVGHLHRGKRTMLVDGKNDVGGRLTRELISEADFLVTNFTLKSQARYGIDYARVRRFNSRLVHCSITAYGQTGPWAHRRGYENQCNAATGMSWRYGARFGWTLYQPTPINDAVTGVLGAYAVAVALYARQRNGNGQQVAASLAQGSTLHQAIHLTMEAKNADQAPDAGRSEYGHNAMYRLYRAQDGWMFLAVGPGQVSTLLDAVGLEPLREHDPSWADPDGVAARRLAARFAEAPRDTWVAALVDVGIAAQQVVSIDEAVTYLEKRGVVYFERGVDGRDVARPGIGQWLSDTPPHVGSNPGAVGSQIVDILTELGVAEDDIRRLAEADVVALPDRLPTLTRLT